MSETLELKPVPENSIIFSVNGALPEEYLRLEKGYFWYRGEKIEDIHQVYERFSEWLTKAEMTQNGETE